jgi:hypothetical protein
MPTAIVGAESDSAIVNFRLKGNYRPRRRADVDIHALARIGARQRLQELEAEIAELRKLLGEPEPTGKVTPAAVVKGPKAKKTQRATRPMSPEMRKKLAANLAKARAALAAKRAGKK